MRRAGLVLIGFMSVASSAALADDCSKAVATAVEKQRTSKAFRMSTTQGTAEGPVDMTVDYLPPDRMLQVVVGKHLPGKQQTMLVGKRAFSGVDGAYEELLPHLAQSVVSEVATALEVPATVGTFACAGKQTFEGKEYVAYRAVPKDVKPDADPDTVFARTIYVDEATGMPAYNIVAAKSGKGDVVLKIAFSYPTDLVIEAPEGAPIQRSQ